MIRKVAVGLRWSDEAEAAVHDPRGMRHRSARRFSFDHPDVPVVVVSEDGPVTVYRSGEVVGTTSAVEAAVDPGERLVDEAGDVPPAAAS